MKETPLDTIAVRADETIDERKLAGYLKGKLPEADRPLAVRQFGGGMANLTYLLSFEGAEYVLRRPPLGPVAKSAHDMGREYKVLSRLYEAFPLAPRAYLYCEDESIIGAPFFVMERHEGIVVRRKMPVAYANIPKAGRRMSEALVDALAQFHAVDYEAIGLGDLGRPQGFISRQIEGWYGRWQKAKHTDLPEMDETYAWLKENLPDSAEATLLHNDYKLDNCMLAADDPGKLVAIFDWDMCTLGDPLADVGSLLAYWTDDSDLPYMKHFSGTFMPVGDYGFISREEIVARYEKKSGRDLSNINYYHALSLYRLTVIIAQIYIRYLRGQTQDKRFAPLRDQIPLMGRAALDVAMRKAG